MKRQFLTKKQFGKRDMTSVNFEKTLEYFKIQKSLWSENLTKYYLCKGIFLCFSLSQRYYTSTKSKNH